jgi:DnaJ-class molecular chaperone
MAQSGGKSLYDILGVNKTASSTDIKKAYLRLARTHHPDKGGDPEKFKEIAHANEILSDEMRRRRYDELGVTDDSPAGPPGGMPSGFPFPFEMNVNLNDFFGNMFGTMPPMGAHGQSQQRKGKKPSPTVQTVPIRLEQYYLGHQFEINIHRQSFCQACEHTGAKSKEICRRCHGNGSVTQVVQMGPMAMHTTGPCPECQGRGQKIIEMCAPCNGSGFTNERRNLTIRIPPGTRPQETYIFPEVCSDHPAFERPADAHILLQEDPNDPSFKIFKRVGDQLQHLETTFRISLSEGLLGVVIQLDGHPGYDEGLHIQIPPGTFHLDTYVVEGLGMPLLKENGKYGELHIRIEIYISDEERRQMANECASLLRPVLETHVRPSSCPKDSVQCNLVLKK